MHEEDDEPSRANIEPATYKDQLICYLISSQYVSLARILA